MDSSVSSSQAKPSRFVLMIGWCALFLVVLQWGWYNLHPALLILAMFGVIPCSLVLLVVGVVYLVSAAKKGLPLFRSIVLVAVSSLCIAWQSMSIVYDASKKPVFGWYKTLGGSSRPR